ncbi:MAG: carboxymuconolactone decarboxylase family protein [Planctomycetes bacterium]|nr:carboxymuconolactone decarboxylase family protein [Planctomycetota bacterium]
MTDYYDSDDVGKFDEIGRCAPELARRFFDWYQVVFEEGALTEREKALIALAVAHVKQCPYCIDAYTKTCLEKGADLEQMTEAVHVAAGLKAGACLVHAVQMKRKHDSLSM